VKFKFLHVILQKYRYEKRNVIAWMLFGYAYLPAKNRRSAILKYGLKELLLETGNSKVRNDGRND